jgi:hypothetical protein
LAKRNAGTVASSTPAEGPGTCVPRLAYLANLDWLAHPGLVTSDNPAALIAMDIATAIHAGALGPGQRIPSQTALMDAYKVAMDTAAAALRKLREHGLTRTQPGRGVVVAQARRGGRGHGPPVAGTQ